MRLVTGTPKDTAAQKICRINLSTVLMMCLRTGAQLNGASFVLGGSSWQQNKVVGASFWAFVVLYVVSWWKCCSACAKQQHDFSNEHHDEWRAEKSPTKRAMHSRFFRIRRGQKYLVLLYLSLRKDGKRSESKISPTARHIADVHERRQDRRAYHSIHLTIDILSTNQSSSLQLLRSDENALILWEERSQIPNSLTQPH